MGKLREFNIEDFIQAEVKATSGAFDFEPEPVESLNALSLPDDLVAMIRDGWIKGRTIGDGSASDMAFLVARKLAELDVPREQVAGILIDAQYGISAHALGKDDGNQQRRAVRTAGNARDEVDAERAKAIEQFDDEPQEAEAPMLREEMWLDVAAVAPDEIPPTPWLTLGLLLHRAITLLAGKGGAGKSLLAWQIAVAVAAGIPFACWPAPARPRKVAILSGEDDIDEIRRRVAVACQAMGVERSRLDGMLRFWSTPGITLVKRDKEGEQPVHTDLWEQVQAALREWDAGLLVIDPAIKASSGMDESSNSDMEEVQNKIRSLTRGLDCAVLLLDHARKGDGGRDSTRGASSKVDDARIAAELRPLTDIEYRELKTWRPHESLVLLQTIKQNYGAPSGRQFFEFVEYQVGNGETRPALVHRSELQMAAPIWGVDECPFHKELLAMIRDGREDGKPWLARPKAAKAHRLGAAVAERFSLTEKASIEWLQAFEQEGLIERFEWKNPASRMRVECWRLPETESGTPG